MSAWDGAELEFDAATFCGVARLFPLPNFVLYPHVMQPLHIFEDRYREMVRDALAGDRLITMTMLEPGWEDNYEDRPPVASFGCLGKIVAHHCLEDGRYNLLLLGLQRVHIRHELAPLRLFRQAEVELIDDCYACVDCHEVKKTQQTLLAALRRKFPCACDLPEQLEDVLSQQLPLGVMTDLAAFALPLDVAVKQRLLAEPRVIRRARTLLAEIDRLSDGGDPGHFTGIYPPRFSAN